MKRLAQRVFCLMLAIIVFGSIAHADSFSSKQHIDEFIKGVIPNLVTENYKEGFYKLKPYWPIPGVEIDSVINKIDLQMPTISKRFGKVLSMEFIKSESIGASFYKIVYLQKYESHAMVWDFSFYKPADVWFVNQVYFSDSLRKLYE